MPRRRAAASAALFSRSASRSAPRARWTPASARRASMARRVKSGWRPARARIASARRWQVAASVSWSRASSARPSSTSAFARSGLCAPSARVNPATARRPSRSAAAKRPATRWTIARSCAAMARARTVSVSVRGMAASGPPLYRRR
ncbi:MAG TPA: hypothetical protein VHO67_11755 [Polyangia bacterium]|nr:hypothetical protein [Polyangia bacterium]